MSVFHFFFPVFPFDPRYKKISKRFGMYEFVVNGCR